MTRDEARKLRDALDAAIVRGASEVVHHSQGEWSAHGGREYLIGLASRPILVKFMTSVKPKKLTASSRFA